jgi:hypothetical protein
LLHPQHTLFCSLNARSRDHEIARIFSLDTSSNAHRIHEKSTGNHVTSTAFKCFESEQRRKWASERRAAASARWTTSANARSRRVLAAESQPNREYRLSDSCILDSLRLLVLCHNLTFGGYGRHCLELHVLDLLPKRAPALATSRSAIVQLHLTSFAPSGLQIWYHYFGLFTVTCGNPII